MMREIYTRFGRDNIGFAWIIAEPAIFCLAIILLWSMIKHQGHADTPIVPFLLTGYMPLLLFRHMTGRLLRCMQANAALLYHRSITILTLYMARIGVELLGTSAAFASCLVIFWFAGLRGGSGRPLAHARRLVSLRLVRRCHRGQRRGPL
jgi:capsular polysaccharide transport system permease protein